MPELDTPKTTPFHPLRVWLHDHGSWLLALLALLTLGLGTLGFQQYYATLGQMPTWQDLLYAAIRLFNLESGQVDGALPWMLELARWLAPLVLFYAVIYGVLITTRQQAGLLWARTHYRDHLILCGLGEQGVRLAEDLLSRKDLRLVAIEPDQQLDALTQLRERGLNLWSGAATDEVVLRKAGVQRAHYLIAATGSDEDNLKIAAKAFKLTGGGQPPGKSSNDHPLICHVQVTNIGLRQLFHDHPLFAINTPRFDGRLFNLYERGARHLLEVVAPDRCCPVRGPDDPAPHILIVGLGSMGQQVALQAARIGHYANGRKLRLTVVAADGGTRDGYLRWLYPVLSDVVDWTYLDAADYGASPVQLAVWRRDPALAAVYICLDDDAQGLNIARRYHQHLKEKERQTAIVVCLSQHTGLAELLAGRFGDAKKDAGAGSVYVIKRR
jgi:voltage-gated potassium channel Kch